MRKIDLTNQKFGLLTVIEPGKPIIHKNGRKRTTWVCQCECGNITTVRTEYLQNGHTQSCGCLRGLEEIIGKKFGRLTVLEYAGNSSYLCECDCGNKVTVLTSNLKKGNTKSCGCLSQEIRSSSHLIDEVGNKYGMLTVESYAYSQDGKVYWNCVCDCGAKHITRGEYLRSGQSKSCGCHSRGESEIASLLKENNILFRKEQTFEDLISPKGKKLRYDFAILNLNNEIVRLVEFDGAQHSKIVKFFGGEEYYNSTIIHDRMKDEYALKNNIPLIRIPYSLNKITLETIFGNKFLVEKR